MTSSIQIAPKVQPRILPLDMTKGVLILLILVYHCLGYSTQDYLAFKYLGLTPVSFIFITGLLISDIYLKRFRSQERLPCKRLLLRGGKLMLLFVVLNLGIASLHRSPAEGVQSAISGFFNHWWDIFFTGEGRFASFQILLPIAYLLLLAPALLLSDRLHRWALPGLALALVLTCLLLSSKGLIVANAALISAGFLGVLVGAVKMEDSKPLTQYYGLALLAYLCSFGMGLAYRQTYIIQVLEGCTGVALIFSLCTRIAPNSFFSEQIIMLGQYSLLSYIVQIGILQAMTRFIGHPALLSAGFLSLLCGGLFLMIATIRLVAWCRSHSTRAEELYRVVFA